MRILIIISSLVMACACTPPPELDANDLGPSFDWPEIMDASDPDDDLPLPGDARVRPLPGDALVRPLPGDARVRPLPGDARVLPRPSGVDDHMLLTPERLALLPVSIRQRPKLAQLAISRALENPIDYQGGVYGLIGPAKVFLTTQDHIKSDVRLYWVMVKVLSEKYGCFMLAKINYDDKTRVTCRDKRQIVFTRTRGDNWIQFLARQYDKHGYEIVVRKRQIVRIGTEKAI